MQRALSALAVATVLTVGFSTAVLSLQQDLAAYDTAGAARRAGVDPYVNQVDAPPPARARDDLATFRHSRFLYPPLVAELFRPLAAVPYRVAKLAFTLSMIAAWLGTAALMGGRARPSFLVASALFFPLWRHLERGQLDLLLLLLLTLAWRRRDQAATAGLALATAIAIKPGLAGVALVLAAVGHARAAVAAALGLVVVAGLTVAIDGGPRLREYLTVVMPRASLYGEGGTEMMLLPESLSSATADDDGTTRRDGRAYRTGLWELPVAASLPRLLAPEEPTWLTALLPFGVALVLLLACARRCVAVGGHAAWLFWGAALTSVVTSPAGWVMGLVFALPLAPALAAAAAHRAWPFGLTVAAAVGWLGMAVPWPVAGVAALGAALLIGVAAVAGTRPVHEVAA